jgi:hypothetical protein
MGRYAHPTAIIDAVGWVSVLSAAIFSRLATYPPALIDGQVGKS